MIGQTISHYRILEKLGEGGMGVVYKAEDTKLERIVALKFLPPHHNASDESKARFLQEARAASALSHPNVCTIFDIKEFEDQTFIVMEYVEGQTLRKAKEGMSGARAIEVIIQVLDGLAAAHEKGIVHRDIKADNIMVRADGRAQIMDFGLAKLPGVSLLTRVGSTVGTTAYMSPEQAQGGEVDHRTDVFSLGVVLYEMLTGQLPFRGAHEAAVMYEVINVDPEPPSTVNPNVDSRVSSVVMRCLEKDLNRRYQSARDVTAALKGSRTDQERSPSRPVATGSVPISNAGKSPWLKIGIPAGVLLLAAVLAVMFLRNKGEALDSLAVLPFENVGNDQTMEYLSDGITESIINSLSQLPQLKVMSRSSVFRFKGKIADPQAVGQQLGVRALLLGRVQQRGEVLLVSAELIDVSDNSQLWGQQYNRKSTDILLVQEEITKEISRNLRLRLGEKESELLVRRPTESTEAYQLYLKGRYHWNKRRGGDLQKAAGFFNEAIQSDPGYALAYAGLADAYVILGVYADLPPSESFPRARAAALKALEIDPEMAEAHATLGDVNIHYYSDWVTAGKELERAIELNPAYAVAHHWYSEYLTVTGRHSEAIASTKKARALDPLSPSINTFVGWNYYCARQFDSALVEYRKAVDLDPGFPWTPYWMGKCYQQMGRHKEAIAALEKAASLYDQQFILATLAHSYSSTGRTPEANAIFDRLTELSKERFITAYSFAEASLGLRRKEETLDWLEKAYQERSGWLLGMVVDPLWDPFRSEPRFIELLKKIGAQR